METRAGNRASPGWKTLYQAALLELDLRKLPQRISEAECAIRERSYIVASRSGTEGSRLRPMHSFDCLQQPAPLLCSSYKNSVGGVLRLAKILKMTPRKTRVHGETPVVCPVCGNTSIEAVKRTALAEGTGKSAVSGVLAYRCGEGHLFLFGTPGGAGQGDASG